MLLSMLWAMMILAIGGWWVYLLLRLDHSIKTGLRDYPNIQRMALWEGSTFFILLIFLSSTLLFLFLQDKKKTRSLQAFFAGMTHEMKTPLASVRLQAEVIHDLLEGNENERIRGLSDRLIEDAQKMENQMDKVLQLSRLERGGNLHFSNFKITPFIKSIADKWAKDLTLEFKGNDQTVYADQFALELIFRNFLENTKIHTNSQKVNIGIEQVGQQVHITYFDGGTFSGKIEKLGELFYKHDSHRGSGIGLYLIKGLIKHMKGNLEISKDQGLIFKISLPTSKPEEAL